MYNIIERENIMYRICSKCGLKKRYDEYYKALMNKFRIQRQCKCCMKQSQREYRQNNKEKYKEYMKEWRTKHPQYYKEYYMMMHPKNKGAIQRAKTRKYRAEKYGVCENFIEQDEETVMKLWKNKCAICGITQKQHKKKCHRPLCVDHWKPLQDGNPLTIDNAVLLCIGCNNKKGNEDPKSVFNKDVINKIESRLNRISIALRHGKI